MPAPKARQWYRIENAAADPTVAEIHIVDFIGDWIDDYWGFGVTAKAFIAELAQLPEAVKTIKVHINSPGGDVFGALNIANALRDQQVTKGRTVETIVDGLAASAASIIMMAGSVVRIADNAMVMVHNPWSVAVGQSSEMRKTADTLDQIRNTIIATYKWHSSLSDEALGALMDAETWMDAQGALSNGFATEVVEGLQAAASIDPKAIAKLTVPAKFKDRVQALLAPVPAEPVKASAHDILRECEAAGLDIAFVNGLLASGPTLDEVKAKVLSAKEAKAAASARTSAITALCATAKMPQLADGYIKGGMAEADVRAHLTTLTALVDTVEIDAGLQPDARRAASHATDLNPTAVYAGRNRSSAKKE